MFSKECSEEKPVVHEKGITYFSKSFERHIFFLVTLFMAGLLLLEKIGVL